MNCVEINTSYTIEYIYIYIYIYIYRISLRTHPIGRLVSEYEQIYIEHVYTLGESFGGSTTI